MARTSRLLKKALVELDGKPFKFFEANRDQWAEETCYVYPGAIQYYGPAEVCDLTTRTLALEQDLINTIKDRIMMVLSFFLSKRQ